jgi:hypothetical protein
VLLKAGLVEEIIGDTLEMMEVSYCVLNLVYVVIIRSSCGYSMMCLVFCLASDVTLLTVHMCIKNFVFTR